MEETAFPMCIQLSAEACVPEPSFTALRSRFIYAAAHSAY